MTGSVKLPADENDLENFLILNRGVLTARQREVIRLLQMEAGDNQKLEVLIKGAA